MSSLGERIRFAREQKNLLQSDLARLIGVKSAGVISNWEKDLNKPDAEKIVRLCEVLDVSASYLLDYYGRGTFEFTPFEKEHIQKYRLLDPHGKEVVSYIIGSELSRIADIQDIEKKNADLSDQLRHASGSLRIYTYLSKIASAGKGFYFDDIPTDTIEAPPLEGADFIIGVSGDSMEPTFHDGDLVYVQKCQIVQTGEIGIFILNGECLIKEAGENGLISHNPRYDPIPGSDDIICIGKVLGKVK